jgi:predicted RNA-binding Zn ribbon-like protein
MGVDHLALDLAATVRHDGHGGVADDLAEPAGLTRWVRERAGALDGYGFGSGAVEGGAAFAADAVALAAAVEVRTAVRALFARAVLPGPPIATATATDDSRPASAGQALDRLNAALARVPVTAWLDWPQDGPPVARYGVPGAATPADRLAAALARAAAVFLDGPDRDRLRACPAPRCIRYFLPEHARQQWCKPSCGNRARVARHHARHRPQPVTPPSD